MTAESEKWLLKAHRPFLATKTMRKLHQRGSSKTVGTSLSRSRVDGVSMAVFPPPADFLQR